MANNWGIVIDDLSLHHGLVLDDPAVLAMPWVGVRTLIFSLLERDTRLRRTLTKE